MFDVFAFLVNKLLLNTSIPEEDCNLGLVLKKLPASDLKNELEALTSIFTRESTTLCFIWVIFSEWQDNAH
jgi:hypothetical protein|tara:strand:+ start:24440 stop:24652 length:213 start_codon:yes stop_codon:yes gene_type:complete